MSERNINMNEILNVAKEASATHDQTLRDISLAETDLRLFPERGHDHQQKAEAQKKLGNDAQAEKLEQIAEKAFTANTEVIDKLKSNSQALIENLKEIPVLLIKPKEMLAHLKSDTAHMLNDAEITRLEALGFTKDDVRFMAEGELQMRNHLNARLETIEILRGQEDTTAQLEAQNPNTGMSLDAWDKRAQLKADRDLYEMRLNAPRYKDEVDLLKKQFETNPKPDQTFMEYLAEQEIKTLEKKVDFSHADRLRQAYGVASLAKYM